LTYQHQATNKRGVKREDHAIIYTNDRPPTLVVGEANLSKDPIEVIPRTPRDTLEFDSRVNYAKVYTVEHNVKVHFVGQIAPNSRRRFISDYDTTCAIKRNTYVSEE
jgi:hypothetical protein